MCNTGSNGYQNRLCDQETTEQECYQNNIGNAYRVQAFTFVIVAPSDSFAFFILYSLYNAVLGCYGIRPLWIDWYRKQYSLTNLPIRHAVATIYYDKRMILPTTR